MNRAQAEKSGVYKFIVKIVSQHKQKEVRKESIRQYFSNHKKDINNIDDVEYYLKAVHGLAIKVVSKLD